MASYYHGDVNIEYGGTFFNLDPQDFKWGYISAVRVEDLASACGFDGAILVEKITINGTRDRKRIRQAIKCYGWSPADVRQMIGRNRETRMVIIAEALMSYGYYGPDEDYHNPSSVVIQCEPDGPMIYDGWKAEYRLGEGEDLKEHIERKYVSF